MISQIGSLLAIYFVLWWVVLFMARPFGVRNRAEAGQGDEIDGTDPGAPVAALMVRKALWTTLISAVIFAIALYAYRAGWLGVDRLVKLMGIPL